MKVSHRFTIVEFLSATILLAVVATVGWSQYSSFQAMHRDQDRKVAINAIHYNLQEVVLPTLKGYPRALNAAQLTAMDAKLLKDPNGKMIGAADSDYRYEPTGCNGTDVCKDYTLRANLEHEGDFIKTSL